MNMQGMIISDLILPLIFICLNSRISSNNTIVNNIKQNIIPVSFIKDKKDNKTIRPHQWKNCLFFLIDRYIPRPKTRPKIASTYIADQKRQ